MTIWKGLGDLDLIDREDGSLIGAQSGYIIILPSHIYNNDSEYDIKIEGNFPGMTFSNCQ